MTRDTDLDPNHTPATDDATFDSLLQKVADGDGGVDRARLPRVGTIIGEKYRLVAQIGSGGMGAVFSAVHVLTEKPVAVKWTLRSTADERTRQRFLREAKAAGRCSHPNVVDVYDVGEAADYGYLVMQLLQGETLRQHLTRGQFSTEEAVDLLLQAMRGVAAVHKAGVIHRDLKPENIFLCSAPDGSAQTAKVLDFGISAITTFDPEATTLTNEGAIAGTPAYIAPERFENASNIDERTDVYSLGVILYEMLSGQHPFKADTYPAMILAVTRDKPKPPSSLRSAVPRELDRIVLRALAKHPEQRYPNVPALIEALTPFASQQHGHSAKRWKGRALAASCVLGLTGLGAWVMSHDTPAPPRTVAQEAASTPAAFQTRSPYLSGPQCNACLSSHCADPVAACAADSDCTELVDKARASAGPLIADRSYQQALFDYRWTVEHAATTGQRAREGLTQCVRQRCRDTCELGRNFACVNQFDWRASYPKHSDVRLRLTPQEGAGRAGLAGWRIRACALGTGTHCEPSMGSTQTDSAGFATLALDFSNTRPNARLLSEFDGWLELDGGPEFYPQLMRQTIPVFDGYYKRVAVSSLKELSTSHSPRGLPLPDETHGLLQVQAVDCDGWGARGVSIELWQYTTAGYTQCTDCKIAYPDQNGLPDATLHEFTGQTLAEAEIAVPAHDYALILRDTESKRIVSGMSDVEVRPGTALSLLLAPLSREQVAALPAQALAAR